MRRKRVTECSEHPCSTLPCDNQGSCAADDQGFVCSCKNNFAGIEERLKGVRIFAIEDRGLLRAGQYHDEVGHPAYLLPTPRQYLSSATHYLT